jgi:hypothetical protein
MQYCLLSCAKRGIKVFCCWQTQRCFVPFSMTHSNLFTASDGWPIWSASKSPAQITDWHSAMRPRRFTPRPFAA